MLKSVPPFYMKRLSRTVTQWGEIYIYIYSHCTENRLMLSNVITLGVGEDVVSGQSLPVLFDLLYFPTIWGRGWDALLLCPLIAFGGAVSFLVCREYTRRCALLTSRKVCCPWDTAGAVGVSIIKTWLSAAMLFRLVRSLDPDVGVRLCVIPLLCLLCMQRGDAAAYRTWIHYLLVAATVAVLGYVGIQSATGSASRIEENQPSDASTWGMVSASLWITIDAAFAGGHASGPVTLVRVIVLCVLAVCKESVLACLLGECSLSRVHLFLYGALLLMTCGLHSVQTHGALLCLGVRRPTRANILLSSFVILCALEFSWTPASHRMASYVSLGVTLIRCARILTVRENVDGTCM